MSGRIISETGVVLNGGAGSGHDVANAYLFLLGAVDDRLSPPA
jgi:hypothetical protein